MLVTTKFDTREIRDENLQILLTVASDFPIIVRYIGKGDEVPFLIEGYILMWNWETSRYYIYHSLDIALRSCAHTRIRYSRGDQRAGAQGELAQLSEIIQRHGMLWDMVANWRKLSSAKRQAFTAASLATAAALSRARNRLRTGIAERAAMAATIIDSLGRVNPPRTEALHATVGEHARRRALDVRSITVRTDRRQSVLFDENERDLDILRQATAQAEQLVSCSEEAEIRESVRHLEELFNETHDIPFTHFFRRCLRDDLRPALQSLEQGNVQDVHRRIRRVRDAFEVFWFSRELAELRLRLAFALSRRPHRDAELTALQTEFSALRDTMEAARSAGLDKHLRNSPLPRAIRHLSVALLEWGLGDFAATAEELDEAEETF